MITELFQNTGFLAIAALAIAGWIFTSWLRMKHGYPLEGAWGQSLKPQKNNEITERLRLVTSENAQMAAELGALKERVQVLERIATDEGSRLTGEINSLRN